VQDIGSSNGFTVLGTSKTLNTTLLKETLAVKLDKKLLLTVKLDESYVELHSSAGMIWARTNINTMSSVELGSQTVSTDLQWCEVAGC